MSSSSEAMDREAPSALGGTVVVDMSTSVAGQYAGRLFAMNGADVVLVEPSTGSPTRTRGAPASNGEETFLFRHLNQGKQSVTIDVTDPDQRDLLDDLVSRADVVLRDQDTAGPRLAPGTIECVVGQAPEDGPYAGWQLSEMLHQALAGTMNATGVQDREPIYGIGERASYAAGTTAYISAVAALHERRRSGLGQRVGTTVFEALAAMGQNLVSQYSYNGTHETRARYPGFLALVRCADAWVVMFVIRNWPTLCRVFDCEELVDDPRYLTSGDRLERWPEIVDLLQERAASMRADDVVKGCQAGRVSAEKVRSLEDLIGSEHWRRRAVLSDVVAADGSTQTALRRLFVIDGASSEVRAGSPRLAPVSSLVREAR